MERKSFIFYVDWANSLQTFPSEVRLEVYEAIIKYAQNGTEIELSDIAKMAFAFIKPHLDDNLSRYDKVCERNRANGAKGGRPKKTQENPKNPLGILGTQQNPKNLDNYNDNDNDNNIPPPPAHVRTYETSLLTITAEQAQTEIEKLLDNPDCLYLIHQRSQMTPTEIWAHLDEFTAEARVTGKTWRNSGDLTQNLANWMAIKKSILTKQQHGTTDKHRLDSEQQRKDANDEWLAGKMAKVFGDGQDVW